MYPLECANETRTKDVRTGKYFLTLFYNTRQPRSGQPWSGLSDFALNTDANLFFEVQILGPRKSMEIMICTVNYQFPWRHWTIYETMRLRSGHSMNLTHS